ncbi:MAG TPA: RNA methyltransferase, partial [Chitinophagales bacterium]|nr:RNA methyltransferase [Chitinophagales bacterium]
PAMPGKPQIKYIQSLSLKKYRHRYGIYVIEGEKIVSEYILNDYPLNNIYAVKDWILKNRALLQRKKLAITEVSERELKQISLLATPHNVLALARMPEMPSLQAIKSRLQHGLHLALEAIQDPGNLGTIIRIADWFDIGSIFCSEDCVDAYNPKVVQASMGSLARVKIIYAGGMIKSLKSIPSLTSLPLYAATPDGENIFAEELPTDAVILIGNESKGLSEGLLKIAERRVGIPRYGKAESLNAAVAAGIVVAVFRR